MFGAIAPNAWCERDFGANRIARKNVDESVISDRLGGRVRRFLSSESTTFAAAPTEREADRTQGPKMINSSRSIRRDRPYMLRPTDGTSYRVRITPVDDAEPLVLRGAQQERICPAWECVWTFVHDVVVDQPLEELAGDWDALHTHPLLFVIEIYGPDWFDDASLVWRGDSTPMHPVIASIHYESAARMLDHCRLFSRRYPSRRTRREEAGATLCTS